eukprot:GHVP01000116.1.p1 GENE.GHVP01000116.1~~GHVP01000116.1.p1  ORF type:complete len:447 (+),score=39.07 GHVP01000116.1:804-2144(+)
MSSEPKSPKMVNKNLSYEEIIIHPMTSKVALNEIRISNDFITKMLRVLVDGYINRLMEPITSIAQPKLDFDEHFNYWSSEIQIQWILGETLTFSEAFEVFLCLSQPDNNYRVKGTNDKEYPVILRAFGYNEAYGVKPEHFPKTLKSQESEEKLDALSTFLMILMINGSVPTESEKITKLANPGGRYSCYKDVMNILGKSFPVYMTNFAQQILFNYFDGSRQLSKIFNSRINTFMPGTAGIRALLGMLPKLNSLGEKILPGIEQVTFIQSVAYTHATLVKMKVGLSKMKSTLTEMKSCALFHPMCRYNLPAKYPKVFQVFLKIAHMINVYTTSASMYRMNESLFVQSQNPRGFKTLSEISYDNHVTLIEELKEALTRYFLATKTHSYKFGCGSWDFEPETTGQNIDEGIKDRINEIFQSFKGTVTMPEVATSSVSSVDPTFTSITFD